MFDLVSKLAMKLTLGVQSCRDSVLFPREEAQSAHFPINFYECVPLGGSFVPRDTSRAGCVICLHFVIAVILGIIAATKIFFSVVECVVVFVVNLLLRKAHNLTVHSYRTEFTLNETPTHGVVAFGLRTPLRPPVPLIQNRIIVGIDDGILAMSQWDKFDRLVLRLNNLVTLHDGLHGLTSNEIVRCSTALVLV